MRRFLCFFGGLLLLVTPFFLRGLFAQRSAISVPVYSVASQHAPTLDFSSLPPALADSLQPLLHHPSSGKTLYILTLNDTHSQLDPLASGQGGFARVAGLINTLRSSLDAPLLVLHAGDFSQGTPYFNLFGGEVEMHALEACGVHAATLGNHEFDNGFCALTSIVEEHAIPVVCCNYEFSKKIAALRADKKSSSPFPPACVFDFDELRVAVVGVGGNPDNLISKNNFEPLVFAHPYRSVEQTTERVVAQFHPDLVVALSHLGTETEFDGGFSDAGLIGSSALLDVVVGGHTHRLYRDFSVLNASGKRVLACQNLKSARCVSLLRATVE